MPTQRLIEETSERGADGIWRYRDPRMQRVANALVRAELTRVCPSQSAAALRRAGGRDALRGRGAVSAGDAPCTSLPQLTPEGLPLAVARRAAEDRRMARAAAELEARGQTVSSRALAETAHISLNTACTWLRQRRTDTSEPAPVLSALLYSSYSTADNILPSVDGANTLFSDDSRGLEDPLEGATMSTSAPTPLLSGWLAANDTCLAAIHRLLWRWTAGAWQCPLCTSSLLTHATAVPWGG